MVSESPIIKKDAATKKNLDSWIFRDRQAIEKRFGMEMEKVLELYNSDDGRKKLLLQMKQIDPSLNGNVDNALRTVSENMEELKKKESFLAKMLKLPVRTVKAVAKTVMKYPVLSALGVAAIIAALIYFFGPTAATVGSVASKAGAIFKDTVLTKIGVPTPSIGMEAAAELPVSGGLADPSIAATVAESAGEMAVQNAEFIQAGKIPEAAVKAIRSAAETIVNDPNVQNINPTKAFMELLEKTPK
jgi:hypothetical protein